MAKIPKPKKYELPKLLLSVDHVLTFGKYKGLTILEVMRKDANWIHWALEEIPNFKLNRNALLLLPEQKLNENFNDLDDLSWGDWHDMH